MRNPTITVGADNLPHCAWCRGDDEKDLCDYHGQQVRIALNGLRTANRTNGLSPLSNIAKKMRLKGGRED